VLQLLGILAEVPVLLGNGGLGGVEACRARLHVTVDLDGVQVAALVGVDPVFACGAEGGGSGSREGGEWPRWMEDGGEEQPWRV